MQWYRLLLLAAYGLATAHALYYALSMGMSQQFFVFLSLMTLTFELERDFSTMYLSAKFDRPTFSRSEVIVRTNKQTNTLTNKQTLLKTSTSLRYATPVGNSVFTCFCFCFLAFLDPRVGHTMDVLSPFISMLCHSD